MATTPKNTMEIITDSVTGNKYSRDTAVAGSTYKPVTPITPTNVGQNTINNIDVNKFVREQH